MQSLRLVARVSACLALTGSMAGSMLSTSSVLAAPPAAFCTSLVAASPNGAPFASGLSSGPLGSSPSSGPAASSLSSGLLPSSTGPVPVCISQQGNVVTIQVGTSDAGNLTLPLTATSETAPPGPDLLASTYAQRQTIRDHYRGQIDELTFNDELGDGVDVFQALSDAMAAHATSKPAVAR